MHTLYTMGYLAARSEKKLSELIALGIPLIDVRYNPDSKRWQWTKDVLESKAGLIYHWVQNLGNLNYKAAINGHFTESDIQIKDIDAGLTQLAEILSKYSKACLLCACADKSRCHRSVVACEAVIKLGVKIVHI
jgi:uncharacterized protein (DUF488 family)